MENEITAIGCGQVSLEPHERLDEAKVETLRFWGEGLAQDRRSGVTDNQSQKVRRSVQARTGFEAVEAKPILHFALRSCMLFNSDSGLGGGG